MASASGYNHQRFARAVLKKSRKWEASLVVQLYPFHWRFESSVSVVLNHSLLSNASPSLFSFVSGALVHCLLSLHDVPRSYSTFAEVSCPIEYGCLADKHSLRSCSSAHHIPVRRPNATFPPSSPSTSHPSRPHSIPLRHPTPYIVRRRLSRRRDSRLSKGDDNNNDDSSSKPHLELESKFGSQIESGDEACCGDFGSDR